MIEATIENMELGNLMFGHSRGEYAVEPRDEYQEMFCDFLFENNADAYGFFDRSNGAGHFENDTFIVRPYYWGEDESIAELPNFLYKPSGLEIRWYKYPMRDAYSNMDISPEDFRAILNACRASLKRDEEAA